MWRYFTIRRRSKLKYPVLLGLAIIIVFYYMQHYDNSEEEIRLYRLQRYLSYQTRPPREGPGENGAPVTLAPEEQKIADEKWKNASFNVVASDKIALDRAIPDTRRKE